MSKVVVRVAGGIGNQLFSYAAGRRLAVANSMELVIDNVSGFIHDKKYKRTYQLDKFSIPCRVATNVERMAPFARLRQKIRCKSSEFRKYVNRTYVRQDGIDFDERLLKTKWNSSLYLHGYWQSENYFKDIQHIIRQDLLIDFPRNNDILALANKIKDTNSVMVHLRYFDDVNLNSIYNLPISYYIGAKSFIEEKITNPYYFVFSDNPNIAKQHCDIFPKERTIYVFNNADACVDLWMMSLCKHAIIANSTFSWWGAWLSTNKNKYILCPALHITSGTSGWGFKGLIPEDWIIIDF